MAIVATLLKDQLRIARISAALSEGHVFAPCDSWHQLLNIAKRSAVGVAVVDPLVKDAGAGHPDPLRELRRTYSAVAIVAYVSIPPASETDLFEYGRLGLDGVAIMDRTDHRHNLRAIVERAVARGLLDPVRRALGDSNPTVRDAVLMAISRAQQRLSPESMARAMGVSRPYLAAQLASQGFPSPQQLIAMGRLIVASRMLEDEKRSANSVAAALDFASASAFRNSCQRYLGASPGEIRERGGACFALAALFQSAGRPAPGLQTAGDRMELAALETR
ncbi:MAG TPA: AraC family transcriptional regulator [Gemmatimonadaceae bacterium]|nr:AraC family transcriptional regulator [Gemmatimonadaceae bacterium]